MRPDDRKQGIYNYWPYISQLRYSKLVCGVLKLEGICRIKMIPIREGSMELRVHENCGFFSSCKYTQNVACQLSWPHDILLCVLIHES